MRLSRSLVGIIAVAGMLAVAAAAARAETLEQYLQQKAQEAFANANQCDQRNQSMRTFPNFNDRVLDDHRGVLLGCHQAAPPNGTQLTSFQRCARLYACTEYVYECARTKILRNGQNTEAAEKAALTECREQIGIPNG